MTNQSYKTLQLKPKSVVMLHGCQGLQILCCCHLPVAGKRSFMSSKSNRTVAIVDGPEKYDTIKTSLNFFFQEVNELIERQTISIDGKEIKLKLFLRGVMKFLLMIMGMNSVTADYACLWCKIFKGERWDTSKPSDYYNM